MEVHRTRGIPSLTATSRYLSAASCFDVATADDGGAERACLVGTHGGDVHVLGRQRTDTIVAAHHMGVLAARFFPSGQVVLTAGADTRTRLWSLEDGEPFEACDPLQGRHTTGVQCLAFIGRGRAVVTGARDGTVCIWDVPTQSCTTALLPVADAGAAEALLVADEHLVTCSRAGGLLTTHDLRTPSAEVVLSCGARDAGSTGAFGVAASVASGWVVGTDQGMDPCVVVVVIVWLTSSQGRALEFDARSCALLSSTVRNGAPITGVATARDDGVWLANAVGQAWLRGNEACELRAGPEFGDGLVGVAAWSHGVATCDATHVYEYKLD